MGSLPTPHGDKLTALLENSKLPGTERTRVEEAINRYTAWLAALNQTKGTDDATVSRMVNLLNDYKLYIDIDLIFDSDNDFLYRQKGQLKLDNSIVEEFLPILVTTILAPEIAGCDLSFGPTNSFSGIRFESSLKVERPGAGMAIRSKDQDFAIAKKLFIRASHKPDFAEMASEETFVAYVAAECKTNLDKTMFQEATATALDVKTVVPGAKYYLLCEWLDMTPISTSVTAIDEVLILRKSKRIGASIREQFNTAEGRKGNRRYFDEYLRAHPFAAETFSRFLSHIRGLFHEDTEEGAINRGYF